MNKYFPQPLLGKIWYQEKKKRKKHCIIYFLNSQINLNLRDDKVQYAKNFPNICRERCDKKNIKKIRKEKTTV